MSAIILAKLLFAGLLTDFVFQPSTLVQWKKQQFAGLVAHGMIHLIVVMGLGIGSWTVTYGLLALYLSVFHVAIDWMKIHVDRVVTGGYWPVATFIGDQTLHIVSILMVSGLMGFVSAEQFTRRLVLMWADTRYVYLAIIYVGVLFGGSVLVRLITQVFHLGADSAPAAEIQGAGAYIGVIERIAITTLVALGQYGAVGFVLAAKSIARYKRIEEQKGFGEYYLIGTLTSATVAILAGLLIQRLWPPVP